MRRSPAASPTGGTASIGLFQYERRFPFYGYNTLWNFSGSVTKVLKAHNVKTGIFVEHSTRPAQQRSLYNGTFSFNTRRRSFTLNTNVGFANALLGAVTSFQQADKRPIGHGQFVNTEFYAQDNWRVGERLHHRRGRPLLLLHPDAKRGRPGRTVRARALRSGRRAAAVRADRPSAARARAINPATGEALPAVYIGRPIPGTGNLYNGTQLYEGTPQRRSPFEVAPRLGFAWNVTGDGRTAIRGGAGAFYDRYAGQRHPGAHRAPAARPHLHGQLHDDRGAHDERSRPRRPTRCGGFRSSCRRSSTTGAPAYSAISAGIWSPTSAYVGNAARRQPISRELNGRPYGYRFQPSSLDPTNVISGVTQPLPDDLLRPYRGYASISQREFTGYADYHSVQLSATRRRRADGLTFGAAYTYEIVNKTLGAIDPFLADNRARNYNSVGRRPHTLNIHYSWLVPGLGRSRAARAARHRQRLAALRRHVVSQRRAGRVHLHVPSGAARVHSATMVRSAAVRTVRASSAIRRSRDRSGPSSASSEPNASRRPTTRITSARRAATSSRDPGYVNWDISVFKHIPMGGSRRLQLRVELYNAFDTYQWTTVNTNAEFDFTTGALTNANVFGRLTGATNSARRIQLAARFTF